MDKRIKKQFWFTEKEAELLEQRAKSAGVSQTALLKMLLKGYIPKEKPDDRFYQTMRGVYEMTTTATRLLEKSHRLGVLDKDTVIEETKRWESFILDIEYRFLRPDKPKRKD